jgi:hypothetical protein
MERELQRLSGMVAWLVGIVGRMLRVQAGLVVAVDRLERRTGPDGRHQRPGSRGASGAGAPRRPALRLLVRAADVSLGMLLLALVFGVGQGLLPEGPLPAAEAGPSTTARVRATATANDGRRDAAGTPAGPAGRGGWAGRGSTGQAVQQQEAALAGRPVVAPTTAATLPGVTSTTLPLLEPSVTVPEVTTTTRLCRNPHGCDEGP